MIQKEMINTAESGVAGKFGNGFSLIDLIRPIPNAELDKDQETNEDPADEEAVGADGVVVGQGVVEADLLVLLRWWRRR